MKTEKTADRSHICKVDGTWWYYENADINKLRRAKRSHSMKTWRWKVRADSEGRCSGGALIRINKDLYIIHRWSKDKTAEAQHEYYNPNKKELDDLKLEFNIK